MTLKLQGTIIELFIKTTLYYVTIPSSVKIVNVLYIVGQKRIEQLRWNILVVIGTDCIGSCKSNYHTIITTTAP
jgi:hypothetical protein